MIKKGGQLTLRIPTKDDLLSWLKKGIPLILTMKIGPLYGMVPSKKRRKTVDQHGVVVYGYDGKNFLINDPSPARKAIKKLPADLTIYSWYRAKCYTLLVTKQ
ncbi:MAG: C39 family peptidase [Candidatus Aenigmarchaeota archaeon]|nr:C39 family peptidase [Candidatus Aenigmarchaeota archaeon]